ncbi:hypothetical protein K438DRAFT_1024735 [Mycena galopus ATCC 62051]|nr:hypothetical protein K438DRAFT_1024735 [Mycena galopus ATCC 62051]
MMSIRLRLDSFGPYNRQGDQSSFYEDSPSSNYHDDGENIKSAGEVHPECQLVATLVDSPSFLDSVLLPYVSSSKLHCFCCHLWLDAFNKMSTTKVAFDGSHGDVQPDWLPPTLQAPLHEDILTQMCGHVEFEVWRRRTGTFSEAPRSTDADKKAREARRAFVALKLSKARETNEKPLSREEERKRWEATQVICKFHNPNVHR